MTLNKSEQEVADTLDSLGIAWEYEPRMFVLVTNEAGQCKEGFRPDFYLPKYDVYIEVTMGRNSNITTKNHKARLLRGLYPGVRVEFVFRRHFTDVRGRLLEIVKKDPSSTLEEALRTSGQALPEVK